MDSGDDDYETTDASDEMDLLEMDSWGEVFDTERSEASHVLKRFLNQPCLQKFVIDPNNPSGTGIGVRVVFTADKQESEDTNNSKCNAVEKLFTRNTSKLPDIGISTICRELCLTCRNCMLLHKVRDRSAIQDDESALHEDYYFSTKDLKFWNLVDNHINMKASETGNDPYFSITLSLHKSAIMDNHLMEEFKDKIEEQKLEGESGLIAGNSSNAIQTEELQLTDVLKHAVVLYSDFSLDSKALLKLEMLDIMDDIVRGLRILWEKEIECRKDATSEY